MLRELLIATYLLVVTIIFNFSKLFDLQNKTTFVISFPGNNPEIIEKLIEQSLDENIVVIKATDKHIDLTDDSLTTLQLHHPLHFIQSIYHLATSRHIFVDNYYGFLAAMDFKDDVNCVQVWHAVGALKSFGLKDKSIDSRTKKAYERFLTVYNRFDSVIVGSEKMEQVFRESFGIEDEGRFLRTGIPRTDFFYNDFAKQQAMQRFKKDFPLSIDRKVILYAPTYRDNELEDPTVSLQLDLAKMYNQFKSNYIILLRLHPALNQHYKNKYPGFVFNVTDYDSINTLLIGTDILITDYSSIPFEFALLNKPMIFYTYDLDNYRESRGLPNNYESSVPGPIAFSTDEIIELINNEQFHLERIKPFAQEWNEFSDGYSTDRLIENFYGLPATSEQIQKNV